MKASLITPSFRGDLELAKDLCASVDAFVPNEVEHILLVPQADRDLFQPLAGPRRHLRFVEDILPKDFIRLPRPSRLEIKPFFSYRLRDIYWTPAGLVRGWIIQQIIKLSADAACDGDVLIFADSDIVFARPVTMDLFEQDGKVRLYHRPGETKDSADHRSWHHAASHLLGLPENDYFGADYIGNVLTWRRDVLAKLQNRIADVGGRPWQVTLAKTKALSEYILYGIFAEHVLKEESGHFCSTQDLVNASWHYEVGATDRFEKFIEAFRPEHIAVLIQSTEDLSINKRRELVEAMTGKAETMG